MYRACLFIIVNKQQNGYQQVNRPKKNGGESYVHKTSSLLAQRGKTSVCSAGDLSLIPGLGRSPRKGNGNPLQYSRLENSMD